MCGASDGPQCQGTQAGTQDGQPASHMPLERACSPKVVAVELRVLNPARCCYAEPNPATTSAPEVGTVGCVSPREFSDARTRSSSAMARQIAIVLALACSCAGFRAPAAAGRATRPALSRRAWKIAMDENNDPKAAETNAEATDGSGNLR